MNTGFMSLRTHAQCMKTTANRDTTAAPMAWRIGAMAAGARGERSALSPAGEVPRGELKARNQQRGLQTFRKQRAVRPNATHGVRSHRVRVGLGESQVPDRFADPAVLDQPDTVASQPGHDERSRIEDARVPEVAHEDPALDAADELVDSGFAGEQHGRGRYRAERIRTGGRIAGARGARLVRGPPVVQERPSDP